MVSKNYGLVSSFDDLKALVDKLGSEDHLIGFDIETGYLGLDTEKGAVDIDWDAQFISGFSITNSPEWARYVPLGHDVGGNLPEVETWELVKPLLETKKIVCHNDKFEIRNLRSLARKGRGPRIDLNCTDDSMLQSYVLSLWPSHGLKDLVWREFEHKMTHIEELFPDATSKQLKALRFNTLDLTPEVVTYACEDAAWCLALQKRWQPLVEAERSFMWSLEMKIMYLLCDLEDAGHAVDWDALSAQHAYAAPFQEAMVDAARKGLGQMTEADLETWGPKGTPLNLASSKQMGDLLYETMGLRTTVKTKSGKSSTGAIALEALSREHAPIKKVLESREIKNLEGRLKRWVTDYARGHDSRVHANFNQVVVGSGRFSANDPSIQQLPKEWRWSIFPKVVATNEDHWAIVKDKAEFGKHYWEGNFRDFLTAGPDCYLLGYDYSQIELRMLAGLSQEPALLDAFDRDQDIHTTTAAMMLRKPVADIKSHDRAIGKTMNFALLYGMGAKSLAERLALTRDEADALYASYFSAFTKVAGWMDDQKNFGKRWGYIETHFKRKWTMWDLQSTNPAIIGKGERLCVNAPVQGSAADYMKISMLRAKIALEKRGWWNTHVRMINNLHDALTFEVNNEIDPAELRALLSTAVVWPLEKFPKIVADWEIGQRWGSSAKWKDETPIFENGEWRLGKAEPIVTVEELPPYPPTPEWLVVRVDQMPTREQMHEFDHLLTQAHGPSRVRFVTPEGSITLSLPTGLSPADESKIARALGGAQVYYEEEVA